MKVSQMFPNKYATGEDLQGRARALTITAVKPEEMRGERKWIVYFEGAGKGVILSRTLAQQIAAAVGSDDTDLWRGKTVELYPEKINVAGQPRTAIRARQVTDGN